MTQRYTARYLTKSGNGSDGVVLAEDYNRLEGAAQALIDDVRRRYPGEALRCPYMIALDQALTGNTEAKTP